uniref:Uncharacterized protein n=1 Tax=Timema monikensis TaxID=170555 RepID=A0A7R9EC78_9NEOP|nr:unnamed protein product [Timema monikensis]
MEKVLAEPELKEEVEVSPERLQNRHLLETYLYSSQAHFNKTYGVRYEGNSTKLGDTRIVFDESDGTVLLNNMTVPNLGYRLEDMSDIKISNGSLEYYIVEVDKGYSERCYFSNQWLGRHNPGDQLEILQEEDALCTVLDQIEREEYDRVKCISELETYRTYNVLQLEGDEEVSEVEDEPNIIALDYENTNTLCEEAAYDFFLLLWSEDTPSFHQQTHNEEERTTSYSPTPLAAEEDEHAKLIPAEILNLKDEWQLVQFLEAEQTDWSNMAAKEQHLLYYPNTQPGRCIAIIFVSAVLLVTGAGQV